MLYWRSPSGVPVVLILIVVEVVMKLFKVAVPIIVVSLLQISCASSSKKSPKQNDDASRFTDVKAPKYFIIKVSKNDNLSFRESDVIANEESIVSDFSGSSALRDLSNQEESYVLKPQTGFDYGQGGQECYKTEFHICKPIYLQDSHNVSYSYVATYNEGDNTYLSYEREGLSYYNGAGDIEYSYFNSSKLNWQRLLISSDRRRASG